MTSSPRVAIRHRDGGGFDDLAAAPQYRLDFARRDVLAGAANHVLHPPDDIEIAALVLAEQVAGAEPVANEGVRGRLGFL